MKARRKILFQNLSYAFLAQGMALLLQAIVSLILPSIFEVKAFSFWQLFIFFTSYGGFLHLGLNDGIYLRFGGQSYDELDHKLLGTQLKISILIQLSVGGLIILTSLFSMTDNNRIFVLIMALLYSVISNISMFLGLVFQATNQIKTFSKSKAIYTTFLILTISMTLIFRISSFYLLICLYILARLLMLTYLACKGKELIFTRMHRLKYIIDDMNINIRIGFNLMMAFTTGTFILGVGRLLIDTHWGIEIFGQVSFALLLTKLFLVFINQVGFVIFPVLRRAKESEQRTFYLKARQFLALVLPLGLLSYLPLQLFIQTWMPAYEASLKFTIFFLPLCLFEGKMQMLSNTYFKILRKEKVLLKINIICVILSGMLSLIGIYVFNCIIVVVILMTFSLVVRYVLSEIYFSKQLQISTYRHLCLEISLAIAFALLTWYLPVIDAMISFLVLYSIYFILSRKITIEK